MLKTLLNRVPNIGIVRDQMLYSKTFREKGEKLAKVIEALGEWYQYIFVPRNPGYFYEESVFIDFLIDETEFNDDGTMKEGCLTKKLMDWIDSNIPHETFDEIKDIEVWSLEKIDKIPKGEYMEGKKYALVITFYQEKPYMWVWRK